MPEDTIILTLACGKYLINDLDIGSIGPSTPAFFSQAVLNALVEKFGLHPISKARAGFGRYAGQLAVCV